MVEIVKGLLFRFRWEALKLQFFRYFPTKASQPTATLHVSSNFTMEKFSWKAAIDLVERLLLYHHKECHIFLTT